MINFRDIEEAFYYVSSDQPFINLAVINRKTGKTYHQSDLAGIDEFPENVNSEEYIDIPHKNDLGLGKDLVFDFVARYLPDKMTQVNDIFSRKGAYSSFKSLLISLNLIEKWYEFEDEQTKHALRQWCMENDLEISD